MKGDQMKKVIIGLVVLMVVLSFMGCSAKEITFDGTYKAILGFTEENKMIDAIDKEEDLPHQIVVFNTYTKNGTISAHAIALGEETTPSIGTYKVIEKEEILDGKKVNNMYIQMTLDVAGEIRKTTSKIESFDKKSITLWGDINTPIEEQFPLRYVKQ